jgi:uncharacterized protein
VRGLRARTSEEIAAWYRLSEEERLAIMNDLDERMRSAFAPQETG